MAAAAARPKDDIRSIDANDLERVVAIDRAHSGYSRRRFFEKRFASAAAQPDDFVQIGLTSGGVLLGFAIARLLRGEFGRDKVVAVLDVLGVEPESRDRGLGQSLIERLVEIAKQKEVHSLHSRASWANHQMLRFFDASGFRLSPRLVLERSVANPMIESAEESL